MIDQNKRTTLKSMTAAAAVTAIPAGLTAVSAVAASSSSQAPIEATTLQTGLQIEVDHLDDITTSWLRITNETGKTVTVKHVSPGVVVSKGEAYDINAALEDGPLVINHDEAYSFMVEPMADVTDALPIPGGEIGAELASVTSRYDSTVGERFAMTRRLVLS